MKKILFAFITMGLLAFALAGCNLNNDNNNTLQPEKIAPERVVVNGIRTSYADLVAKTSPAVVRITAVVKPEARSLGGNSQRQTPRSPLEELFPQLPRQRDESPQTGFGSGVIVNEDGTILTNNHVVAGAQEITVELENDKTYDAKVIGTDPPSDLAVLKIEGNKFPFLNLGDSDQVLVGDIVLAIGNPLGIGQTVTSGIISAKGRRTGIGDGSFEDFLQTDASINRGNSGGALINLNGELIGINSQILSPTGGSIGIGFSIPSNLAKSVMEQLIKDGKVRRGMLGVSIQTLNDDIAREFGLENTKGALVSGVSPGSAADKAGIKRGDVITQFNGEDISDGNTLRNKVAGTQPGTEVTLTIIRDGKSKEVKATLGEFDLSKTSSQMPQSPENTAPEEGKEGKLGLNLQPLTPETAERLQLPSSTKGLVVTELDPNGPAAAEGLVRGDVILEINRRPVSTLEDARTAFDKSQGKSVLLLISRDGRTVYMSITPKS